MKPPRRLTASGWEDAYDEIRCRRSQEISDVLLLGKCEYEVLISPRPYNPERDKMTKVDVYWQIRNNWDAFIAYVWEHRKENALCHKDRE